MDALLEVAAFQARPASEQDPRELHSIVRRAAGVAAANAALTAPSVPLTPNAQTAAKAAVLGALIAFLARKRALDEQQLTAVLVQRARAAGDKDADIQPLLDEEARRAIEFARKQETRVRLTLPQVLAIPDGAQRAAAMQALMDREQRYEQQRSEAMFGRSVGGLNATVLRKQSPRGAFWKLSPFVKEHTEGCLVMGERFWPWDVLDRLHPPRHAGCPCHLEGYMAAVSNGWMKATDVPSLEDARARSAGVVMEALEGWQFELEERVGPLREALAARGLVDILEFDRLAEVA